MEQEEHEIPLKDLEPPPMQKKKMHGVTSFILIMIAVAAFFLSPIPSFFASLIPETFIRSTLSGVYQDIILDDHPGQISEPKKYAWTAALPILGYDTGICFTFESTIEAENKAAIDAKRLNKAAHGKAIAEIIVVGTNAAINTKAREYALTAVTLSSQGSSSIICQKFGKRHSIIPDTIDAIFVRPLQPFTPSKVTWATVKTLN